MISGIQVALKNAINAIAPPATLLQDFNYHWKQLLNFYVKHLTDCKVPIHTTGIPRHLERLLEILLQEEENENDPGPCLEYLLQHKLLDFLATLASAETPPGMRTVCLSFLRKLLGRSKHPLLHHASVYGPVQRLINLCRGNPPSPIEAEEIQFLLTLCFLVCKYPHMTTMINDISTEHRKTSSPSMSNSEKTEIHKITYVPARQRTNSNPLFQPLDTQAITLINPDLFSSDDSRWKICTDHTSPRSDFLYDATSAETASMMFLTPRDAVSASQSSSPVVSEKLTDPLSVLSETGTGLSNSRNSVTAFTEDICSIEEIELQMQNLQELKIDTEYSVDNKYNGHDIFKLSSERSKCFLLDALMSYLNSADNTVRIRACEGVMVLASLDDTYFAQTVTKSELSTIISDRLKSLFNAIPAHVDPTEIDAIDVTWGLDSPLWTNEKKFSGCRQVAAFFVWFDYCNQLITEAHPNIADVLAKKIVIDFFHKVITPALAQHHVVLITALITKCIKEVTAPALWTEIGHWIVGRHRDPEMPNIWTSPVLNRLVENCYTDSEDLTLETLKLFEEMIEKRHEHILNYLLLVYLSTRGYYDSTAADSAIASWSDEEDERERDKKTTLDMSYSQSHSRTLAPSNIHRIVNCFLSLVPRNLQTDTEVNNYERYMPDWERQYSIVLTDCSLMAWPLEAVSVDDSASSDSRPEADHSTSRFYMGPFLTMILEKLSNIPKQRYEINLQLTVMISKLALLPHPYLHEFLLNPLLPLVPGAKSLFNCLQKVVKQLAHEVPKIPNFKQILRDTRKRLLTDCPHDEIKEDILFESVIITEEFCKELAAIAYVKYHRSM